MVQLLWVKYGGSSEKPKVKLPSWLSNPTPECTPKRTESEALNVLLELLYFFLWAAYPCFFLGRLITHNAAECQGDGVHWHLRMREVSF